MTKSAGGCAFCARWFEGACRFLWLDAYAVLGLHFVSGVGVEVGGGTVIELVADAEFASDVDTERRYANGYGGPAHVAEERAAIVTGFVVF